jgi:hypothetical protein
MRVRVGDLEAPIPLPRRRRDSEQYVPWRLVSPTEPESCRWQCIDGRWVALTLGHGAEIGHVVVTDSHGRRELVDSYEGALTLARMWRR